MPWLQKKQITNNNILCNLVDVHNKLFIGTDVNILFVNIYLFIFSIFVKILIWLLQKQIFGIDSVNLHKGFRTNKNSKY